jgi:hypothetical protein
VRVEAKQLRHAAVGDRRVRPHEQRVQAPGVRRRLEVWVRVNLRATI